MRVTPYRGWFSYTSSDVNLSAPVPSPRFFISSTHDEFAPRDQMEALYTEITEPKQMIWIEAEDHFFGGALDDWSKAFLILGLVVRS